MTQAILQCIINSNREKQDSHTKNIRLQMLFIKPTKGNIHRKGKFRRMNENNNTSAENTNSDFKYKRILLLYTRLMSGETINKAKIAAEFHVSERSIQRDLNDLRTFFDEQAADGKNSCQLVYSRKKQVYFLRSEKAIRH